MSCLFFCLFFCFVLSIRFYVRFSVGFRRIFANAITLLLTAYYSYTDYAQYMQSKYYNIHEDSTNHSLTPIIFLMNLFRFLKVHLHLYENHILKYLDFFYIAFNKCPVAIQTSFQFQMRSTIFSVNNYSARHAFFSILMYLINYIKTQTSSFCRIIKMYVLTEENYRPYKWFYIFFKHIMKYLT